MYFNLFCVFAIVLGLCSQSVADDLTSVVSWYSTISLEGVTVRVLSDADKKVVVETAAVFLNVSIASISFKDQSKAVELSANNYRIDAKLFAAVTLGDTIYTSGEALWGNSTQALEDAVNIGAYEQLLQTNAVAAGTTHLASASAFPVTFTDPVVSDPTVKKDDNLSLTEGGVAIIVICCLVIFFVVMYMAWDISHNSHGAKHNDPTNPKGYVLNEDEEITVNKL